MPPLQQLSMNWQQMFLICGQQYVQKRRSGSHSIHLFFFPSFLHRSDDLVLWLYHHLWSEIRHIRKRECNVPGPESEIGCVGYGVYLHRFHGGHSFSQCMCISSLCLPLYCGWLPQSSHEFLPSLQRNDVSENQTTAEGVLAGRNQTRLIEITTKVPSEFGVFRYYNITQIYELVVTNITTASSSYRVSQVSELLKSLSLNVAAIFVLCKMQSI
jgi:hypothetical protein